MHTRIKICGITRAEDLATAIACGADALGFVFWRQSPRALTPAAAADLSKAVAPFISKVGLFMDEDPAWISAVLAKVPLDLLQFHGSESARDCERFGRPYIKAIPMAGNVDIAAYAAAHPGAAGFLLDGHAPGMPGGTGKSFNWSSVSSGLSKPIILAGGLTAANVRHAIEQARPYGVDVSSGVESSPGIKDAARLAEFCSEVFRADG